MLKEHFTRLHEQALQWRDHTLTSTLVRSRLCLDDELHLLFEAAKLYPLTSYKDLAAVFADRFHRQPHRCQCLPHRNRQARF